MCGWRARASATKQPKREAVGREAAVGKGSSGAMVVVAVEGCCHGDLDEIYATVERASEELKKRDATSQGVEILLCCGDFQAVRDESDLACLSVPPKYRSMKGFHRYFNGEKTAPVLTLFVGGNHEASNHLQELFHGGWVAHNVSVRGALA